jgi:DNA gyrase/topoisomerase IV subunit B
MKKNHGLKLLKSKHFGNRIQTRIDRFAEEVKEYKADQLADFLFHIEEYLLNEVQIQENNEEDSYFTVNAAARIGEARFWIMQMDD